MQQKSLSNWIDASCGNKADNYAFPLPQIIPLNILFQHPIQIQIYRQTSEIISSLLEYFSASAVYIRALSQIYKQTSEKDEACFSFFYSDDAKQASFATTGNKRRLRRRELKFPKGVRHAVPKKTFSLTRLHELSKHVCRPRSSPRGLQDRHSGQCSVASNDFWNGEEKGVAPDGRREDA